MMQQISLGQSDYLSSFGQYYFTNGDGSGCDIEAGKEEKRPLQQILTRHYFLAEKLLQKKLAGICAYRKPREVISLKQQMEQAN